MTIRLLWRPATILLAALIICIGCTPSGENGDTENPTLAASNPPATGQDEQPPTTVKETGLKPLVLPLPEAKSASPTKLASDVKQAIEKTELPPAMLPKANEPLKRASTKTAVPANSLATPIKPVAPVSGLRANPLRDNKPASVLHNPMRQGETKQPGKVTPNGPIRAQPIGAKPLSNATAEKQPLDQQPLPTNGSQTPAPAHQSAVKSKKDAAASFDPIKENGPIFVGWKKPKLAIVITGREDGYIEPCGCAGLDRMKGGMSRRHTMIEQLRKKGWPLLCIDVGGLSKGYGVQAELKFQITVDGMNKMRYQAIGFSPNDLRLPLGSLVAVAAGNPANPSPFISANVGLLGFAAKITTPWRVVDVGGVKVGITSVMGKKFQGGIGGNNIEFIDPEVALAQVVPEMKKQCKLMILLAYTTPEKSSELSKKFPEFAVVVSAVGPPTPPAKPTVIADTKALLIEVGEKGMDAVVLGLFSDREHPYRYQRVPLDSRFAASKDMKNLMKAYQQQLQRLGLAGLAIKPVTHPMNGVNGEFVGSKACQDCHEPSYDIWKKSGHAKAWDTLLKTDPPRNFDPECISCHVIGWHPTKHFPYKDGFLSEKQTPKMLDVGCESCHGPGEAHVKAEMGNDKTLQERMQKAVRVTKEDAKNHNEKACRNCHDLDNSPDFNFETYWPKIEHTESE